MRTVFRQSAGLGAETSATAPVNSASAVLRRHVADLLADTRTHAAVKADPRTAL